jgi:DivIVA domain-containing protein
MTSELDLPLLPSAEQIRRREFATVRRGYDPDQVREYLGQVATQVETLEKGLRDVKMQSDTKASALSPGEALAGRMATEPAAAPAAPPSPSPQPPTTDDAYAKLTARFGRMIESADREATAVVQEAKADATRILDEARTEADRIRLDAQSRAEEARQQGTETLAKAKVEADRILGSLADRRESLVTQMQEMQSRLLSVAKDLEVAMDERGTAPQTPSPAIGSSSAAPAAATSTSSAPKPPSGSPKDDLVDPRYEDLWASGSKESPVDIPDLAPIDLDFDDDKRNTD